MRTPIVVWRSCIDRAERQRADLSPISIAISEQTGLQCLDFGDYAVIRGHATDHEEVTIDLPENCKRFTGDWEMERWVEPICFMLDTKPSKLFALKGMLR